MLRLAIAVVALAACAPPASAGQRPSFDDVVINLRHSDEHVRRAALRVLREGGWPEAIGPLSVLLTDPRDDIQLEAIDAELSFFIPGREPARRRVGGIFEVRNDSSAAAAFERGPLAVEPHRVPPELIRALVAATKDDNRRVQVEATYALGVIATPPLDKDAADRLAVLLSSEERTLRIAAARVLGRLDARSAGEPLVRALNDRDRDVRIVATEALGLLREDRAVRALTERVSYYRTQPEGLAALHALARIGHPESISTFAERLDDGDARVRRFAVEGLARAGDERAAALAAALNAERSDPVRLAMAFALHRAGQPHLLQLVDAADDPELGDQAKEYLLELGAPLVPALTAYLKDPEPVVRATVADVLGGIGSATALAALEQAEKDPVPSVVDAAGRAVRRIRLRPRDAF
jgi:HEAT repeat protein